MSGLFKKSTDPMSQSTQMEEDIVYHDPTIQKHPKHNHSYQHNPIAASINHAVLLQIIDRGWGQAGDGQKKTWESKHRPTLRKRPPSSEQREYIFWAPSSCCCSHMASRSSSSLTNPARSWHTCTEHKSAWQLNPPRRTSGAYRRAHERRATNRNSRQLAYLVAGVDVGGADPELCGAAPRAEAVGDAVPQVLQLRERQRHCGRRPGLGERRLRPGTRGRGEGRWIWRPRTRGKGEMGMAAAAVAAPSRSFRAPGGGGGGGGGLVGPAAAACCVADWLRRTARLAHHESSKGKGPWMQRLARARSRASLACTAACCAVAGRGRLTATAEWL